MSLIGNRLTHHSELRGRDRESELKGGGRQFTGGPGRVSVCQAIGDNGTPEKSLDKQALPGVPAHHSW